VARWRAFSRARRALRRAATEKWHPEIDTGLHMELVLQAAADLTPEPRIRFAR
jgi:tRNA nucleotidyltransferase (CCA-adding enzyme)